MALTAVSFDLETFGVSFLGYGSLACSRFSPVPGPCLRRLRDVAKERMGHPRDRVAKPHENARTAGTKLAMTRPSQRKLGEVVDLDVGADEVEVN
jgi:hypothetical protein